MEEKALILVLALLLAVLVDSYVGVSTMLG